MNDYDRNRLRRARNTYNSSVAAAEGFTSGRRVQTMKNDETMLKQLLWKHRDYLIDTISDPITIKG